MGVSATFLKSFIFAISLIFLTIGFAALIYGLVKYTGDQGIILGLIQSLMYQDEATGMNIRKYGFLVIIWVGFFMMIAGAMGIFFKKWRNNCSLAFFIGSTLLLAVVFIFLGIAALKLIELKQLTQKGLNMCTEIKIFNEADQMYQFGKSIFCTQHCVCFIKNPAIFRQEILNNLVFDTKTGAQSFMDCEMFHQSVSSNDSLDYQNNYELIKEIELAFSCSGICQNNQYYIFSNINQGQPFQKQGCFKEISIFAQKYGWDIAMLSATFCLMCIVGLAFSFLLLLHPDQDNYQDDEPTESHDVRYHSVNQNE